MLDLSLWPLDLCLQPLDLRLWLLDPPLDLRLQPPDLGEPNLQHLDLSLQPPGPSLQSSGFSLKKQKPKINRREQAQEKANSNKRNRANDKTRKQTDLKYVKHYEQ